MGFFEKPYPKNAEFSNAIILSLSHLVCQNNKAPSAEELLYHINECLSFRNSSAYGKKLSASQVSSVRALAALLALNGPKGDIISIARRVFPDIQNGLRGSYSELHRALERSNILSSDEESDIAGLLKKGDHEGVSERLFKQWTNSPSGRQAERKPTEQAKNTNYEEIHSSDTGTLGYGIGLLAGKFISIINSPFRFIAFIFVLSLLFELANKSISSSSNQPSSTPVVIDTTEIYRPPPDDSQPPPYVEAPPLVVQPTNPSPSEYKGNTATAAPSETDKGNTNAATPSELQGTAHEEITPDDGKTELTAKEMWDLEEAVQYHGYDPEKRKRLKLPPKEIGWKGK